MSQFKLFCPSGKSLTINIFSIFWFWNNEWSSPWFASCSLKQHQHKTNYFQCINTCNYSLQTQERIGSQNWSGHTSTSEVTNMTGLSHFIVIFRQAHQVLPKCPDGQSAMAQTLQEKYMQLAYPTHNLCQLFLSKPVTSSSLPSTFLPLFSYFPDRLYHSVYMLLFPVPLPRVASAHIPQGEYERCSLIFLDPWADV